MVHIGGWRRTRTCNAEHFHGLREVTSNNLCVNLRGVQPCVTEQGLDLSNVLASTEQVGRECMSKPMRCAVLYSRREAPACRAAFHGVTIP